MATVATKRCKVCGHESHAGKCTRLTPLGVGWMVCRCGARANPARVRKPKSC
jgi:hypothetical protein